MMKTHPLVLRLLGACLATSVGYGQGSLTPPGAPGPVMKTLDQVEPRIAISSLPYTISGSGSYYVANELTAPGAVGIVISASDVTLDLSGYSLHGLGSGSAISLDVPATNVVITGGTLSGWGVGLDANQSAYGRFARLTAENCSADGFDVGHDNLLQDCTARNCGDDGFQTAGRGNVFERCRALGSLYSGFWLLADGEGSVLRQCEANDSPHLSGGGIIAGDDCTIEGCRMRGNARYGLRVNSRGLIRDNVSCSNGVGLAVAGTKTQVADNHVSGNADNYSFEQGNQIALLLSEIPETLEWPCSVKLLGSLTCSIPNTNGITVAANDVTIDLAGHTLSGPGNNSGCGIYQVSTGHHLRVFGGSLEHWSGNNGNGVLAGEFAHLTDLQAFSNGWGLLVRDGSIISRCAANYNTGTGIEAIHQGTVISDCVAMFNGINGFSFSGGTATGCSALNNGREGIYASFDSTVSDCTAGYNGRLGIHAGIGDTISGCSVFGNKWSGINVFAQARVANCQISGNGEDDPYNDAALSVNGMGNRIEGNSVVGNYNNGITVTYGENFLTRNTCLGNKTNWVIAAGNICLVVKASTNAPAFSGDAGGIAPGSTDPNANFTY